MLKFYNYDIVFSEIPDEVTLAVNLSNCPNRCEGCHSPWLQENCGDTFNEASIVSLLRKYGKLITCFCFMGGDREPDEVVRLAKWVHEISPKLKIGWYSGCNIDLQEIVSKKIFNYVKIGPYQENLGGLRSRSTNQRLYRIEPNEEVTDLTHRFWKQDHSIISKN